MKGKVVAITGGSGVLGTAMAKGVLEAGATVYLLARDKSKGDKAVNELKSQGFDKVDFVSCDVLDKQSTQDACNTILAQSGKIDVLVNGAGGNMPGATIKPDQTIFDIDVDQFKRVNELNLIGTVIPTIVFAKPMSEAKKGCIINISSMSAQIPLTRVVGYSASKAAIDNFTRSMAVEMTSKFGEGIRVNAIAPGFFVAEQNKALLLNEDGTLTARGNTIVTNTPMKRFGKPEELVSTLLWLCDDRSSFVTGIVVPVDGGFSAFSGV